MPKTNSIFSASTEQLARLYNLDPRDIIYCQALAGGADRGDAFFAIFIRGNNKAIQKYNDTVNAADDYFRQKPGLRVLVNRLKVNKPLKSDRPELREELSESDTLTDESENDTQKNDEVLKKISDKSFILAELYRSLKILRGKERATVLMQIADLQRMKQDDLKEDEEKRVFYLPFVSSCRSCKLMKLYKELVNE